MPSSAQERATRPPAIATPRRVARRLATLALGVAFSLLPLAKAAAQGKSAERPSALGAATITGPAPRLEVPAVLIGAPSSETTLGISLGAGGALPANSYVRIRGLNPQLALTEGHAIAPGAWAVPVAALPQLRVAIPAGAAGRSELSIALVSIDGGVVAEARTTLVVAGAALAAPATESRPSPAAPVTADPTPRTAAPSAAPPAPQVAALPPPPPARDVAAKAPPRDIAPEPAPLAAEARARSEGFLARGRKLLESGDFASARLFFRRAADEGLAEGALALGSTFDPGEIERLQGLGVRADPAEARRWYEKARELGAGAAAQKRLERLGSR